MRKIFLAVVVTLTCLATFNLPAAAKDVWISTNGDRSEWYIMDETIVGGTKNRFLWTNAVLKCVNRDGTFKKVAWKFTQMRLGGGRLENWVYDVDWNDGNKFFDKDVRVGSTAERILHYCLKHLGR